MMIYSLERLAKIVGVQCRIRHWNSTTYNLRYGKIDNYGCTLVLKTATGIDLKKEISLNRANSPGRTRLQGEAATVLSEAGVDLFFSPEELRYLDFAYHGSNGIIEDAQRTFDIAERVFRGVIEEAEAEEQPTLGIAVGDRVDYQQRGGSPAHWMTFNGGIVSQIVYSGYSPMNSLIAITPDTDPFNSRVVFYGDGSERVVSCNY